MKSTFYVTLETEKEDSRSRERLEITVSYKTFKDSNEGKKYKNTYIGGKRVASTSEVSFLTIYNGETIGSTKELNNQEFGIYLMNFHR